MEITATPQSFESDKRIDRVGIIASILCAIHCALTPILLILLPTFGKAWAHPATHWGMAILVAPIAIFMMKKGYKQHGKKKIIYIGALGIILITIGAILPYVEMSPATASTQAPIAEPTIEQSTATSTCESGCCSQTSPVENETSSTQTTSSTSTTGCVDNCCPSITVSEAGEKSLHIPPASIVTTLGGLCLIILHATNLCSIKACKCCHNHKTQTT